MGIIPESWDIAMLPMPYAGDKHKRKSVSGYLLMVSGG